jgi:hypothetical protein
MFATRVAAALMVMMGLTWMPGTALASDSSDVMASSQFGDLVI